MALPGAHQRSNAALAVALARAVAALAGRGSRSPRRGRFAGVRWPGRLDWIGDDVLLDCAHNAEGAEALAAALPEIAAGRPVVLLMSVAEDKDVRGILARAGPAGVRAGRHPRRQPAGAPAAALAAEAARVLLPT